MLGACAHYEPRPAAPERFAAAYDATTLGPAPAGGAWTDEALLAVALDHSAAVKQARATYRAARAAARASRVPPAITLTLVAEYSKDAGGTTPWLYSGLLDIPLDHGARRSTRLETADLTALQALYDYAEAIWTVRSAVAHAHIDRLAADRQIALAEQAVHIRAERAQLLENRIRAGEDARPAGLTAQTDLAAARKRLQDVTVLRSQADLALGKALGVPAAALKDIVLSPLGDEAPLPAAADLAAWRQEAALRRRDVLRALADYDMAEQALKLEVAKQYPDVHLGPGYTFERGQHKIPFDLTLVLPPQDLNQANIKAAEAKRAEAAAKLDAAQAGVITAVDQSSAVLTQSRVGLARAVSQDLPLVERADAAARRSLAAGASDRTDAEATEAAVIDAKLTALDAWRTAWIAAADLEDALRRPSPGESAVLEAAVRRAGESQ